MLISSNCSDLRRGRDLSSHRTNCAVCCHANNGHPFLFQEERKFPFEWVVYVAFFFLLETEKSQLCMRCTRGDQYDSLTFDKNISNWVKSNSQARFYKITFNCWMNVQSMCLQTRLIHHILYTLIELNRSKRGHIKTSLSLWSCYVISGLRLTHTSLCVL